MPVIGHALVADVTPTLVATGKPDPVEVVVNCSAGNVLIGGPDVTAADGLIVIPGLPTNITLKQGDVLYVAAPAPTATFVLITRQ